MERKDFIKGMGVVGTVQLLPQRQSTAPVRESLIATCVISPSETAGRYPYAGTVPSDYTTSALYRSDMIGDLPNAGGGGAERALDNWEKPLPIYKMMRQLMRERERIILERTIVKNQWYAELAEAQPNNKLFYVLINE